MSGLPENSPKAKDLIEYQLEQQSTDCSILFSLPPNISTKSLHVLVDAKVSTIEVRIGHLTVIEGSLYDKIKESTWTLETKTGQVTISLEKIDDRNWPLLIGGPRVEGNPASIDPRSQYLLACQLEFDDQRQQAFENYKAAADAGCLEAQMRTASILSKSPEESGFPIERNIAEAIRYFVGPAHARNPTAMYQIGRAFHSGEGLERSVDRARHWYIQAADVGHPMANYQLGLIAEQRKDMSSARGYYLQSSKAGCPEALNRLGELALEQNDFHSARSYFEAANRIDPKFTIPKEQIERRQKERQQIQTRYVFLTVGILGIALGLLGWLFWNKKR